MKYLILIAFILIVPSSFSFAQENGGDWFDCLIEPDVVVDVGFPVWGVIEKINVERGDLVAANQLLAELQSGVEKTEIEINRARLDFSDRKKLRTEELVANNHVSEFELDQADTDSTLAKLELDRSEETLKLRQIYSPISGVVVDRMMSPGEYVQEQPVLEVASLDPLKIQVILPVTYFGRVTAGDVAIIRPEAPIDDEYEATVTIVDRLIDAASGTMGVTLEMENPGNRLPAGLKCEARFSN